MARAGEHREVLEAFRMFAHDHGWRRRLDEALITGLTAEAAVQRVRNDTRARMLRHARSVCARAAARYRRSLQPPVAPARRRGRARRRPAACRRTPSSSPAPWARPSCSITTGSACAGWCWRRAAAASHVAIVARALGIAAITQVKGVLEAVEPGDAAIVDAEGGELHVQADARGGVGLCRQGPLPGAAPGPICRLAHRAVGHLGRRAGGAAHQCRPPVRPAASRSVRRRRHRPVPHRAAVHDRRRPSRGSSSRRGSTRRSSMPPATGRWCSARSMSAATRCCPISARSKEENPAHRLARHPHGARPAGAVPHPDQGAAQGGGGRELRIMLPMIADVVGVRGGPRADRPRGDDPQAPWPARAEALMVGAMIEVPALLWQLDRILPLGRFRLGRLERPDAVPVRRRPQQYAGGRPLRRAQSGGAQGASRRSSRRGEATRRAAHSMRRDGRQAARGHGADRARLPLDLHGAGLGRAGQGHDPVARCRRSWAKDWRNCWKAKIRRCARS